MKFLAEWKTYRKAIASFLGTALTALYFALEDDKITRQEWVQIALAVLGTTTLTYAVPNKRKRPLPN